MEFLTAGFLAESWCIYDVQVAGADDGYQHNNRLLYQETEDVGSSILK